MKLTSKKMQLLGGRLLLSLGLLTAFAVTPVYATSEVKLVMKEMKRAYRSAMKSTNMSDFQNAFMQLKKKTQDSGKMPYEGDRGMQKTYQEGIEQLQRDYQAVENAIAANDLVKAKKWLEKVRETEKRFHQKLDV